MIRDMRPVFSHDEIINNIKEDPFTGKNIWLNHYRHKVVTEFLPLPVGKLLDFGSGNGLFLLYLLQSPPPPPPTYH